MFAEIITKTEIETINEESLDISNLNNEPLDAKLKILEDEIDIIEDSNLKFKEENDYLKTKINDLDNKIISLNNEIFSQKEKINKFDVDKDELEFLRLNPVSYTHLTLPTT